MRVAAFMHNINRYTGGRYYMWYLAYAFKKLGHDVTVYTDRPAGFIQNNFRGYPAPEVQVVGRREYPDVEADIYLGMPIAPNEHAVKMAEEHGGKALCCIFDTKPALERAGIKWDEYPDEMPYLKSDKAHIVSIAKANNQDIQEWLGVGEGRIKVIYPCINNKALRGVGKVKPDNLVVFISRLVEHKHLDHLIKAARPLAVKVAVISSDRDDSLGDDISWHIRITDEDKFRLLRSARCLVLPSTHEGFGIPVVEAWACGVPVVCYNLPTLREIDGGYGGAYFAEVGDWKDLQKQLILCLEESKQLKLDDRFFFDRMVERMREVIEGVA